MSIIKFIGANDSVLNSTFLSEGTIYFFCVCVNDLIHSLYIPQKGSRVGAKVIQPIWLRTILSHRSERMN